MTDAQHQIPIENYDVNFDDGSQGWMVAMVKLQGLPNNVVALWCTTKNVFFGPAKSLSLHITKHVDS